MHYRLAFENRYVIAHELSGWDEQEIIMYFGTRPLICFEQKVIIKHAEELLAEYQSAGLELPKLYICLMDQDKEAKRIEFKSAIK